MPPHSPSRTPSVSNGSNKRQKTKPSQSPSRTPSLRALFSQQQSNTASKSAKSREEQELEWAIQESLKAQSNAGVAEDAVVKQKSPSRRSPVKVEPQDQDQDDGQVEEDHQQRISSPQVVKAESPPTLAENELSSHSKPTAVLPPPPMPPCEASTSNLSTTPSGSGRNAFSLLMSNSNVIVPTNPYANDGDGSLGGGQMRTFLSTMPYASSAADLDPLLTPSTLLKSWSYSDSIESKNKALRGTRRPRGVPFYKVLTGMPLAVDAFRFGSIPGCVAYFLSHAHSDHYAGLSPSWNGGPIYCTHTTANLIASSLRVPEAFLHPLPLDEEHEIPNSGGVKVTLLAANHCPGSCVFLFRGPRTAYILPPPPSSFGIPAPAPLPFIDPKTRAEKQWLYLHCGDFRASPYLLSHPLIKNSHLDIIYLDTTYLNPRYCFPAQEEVTRECGELVYNTLTPMEKEKADTQRKEWERNGIIEDDIGWRNIKSIKEERQEQIRRRFDSERKGMNSWLQKEEEGEEKKVIRSKDMGTLAKGLFRYEEEKEEEEEIGGEDEEQAWLDAHDLQDIDDEKMQVTREQEEEEEDDLGEEQFDPDSFQEDQEEKFVEIQDGQDDDVHGVKDEHGRDGDVLVDGSPGVKVENRQDGELDVYDSPRVKMEDGQSCALDAVDRDSNCVVKPQDDNLVDTGVEETEQQSDTLEGAGAERKNIVAAIESSSESSADALPAAPDPLATLGKPAVPSSSDGRLLVVVGTYSIGKEKIALSCALRLGTRIFCCDTRKYRIFSQMEDEPLLHSLITRDPSKAQVHVTNLFALNYESLTGHLKTLREQYHCNFNRIIAFRPTGWSYRPKSTDNVTDPNLSALIARNYNTSPQSLSYKSFSTTRDSTPVVKIYNVPYSEHSSFLELTCFIVGLGCQAGYSRIIPTVNVGNSTSRKKMDNWIKKWKEEVVRRKKRMGNQANLELGRAREYF
ncbi:unnamed protein product [Sympodiomycopsis kandeliae]